MDKSTLFDSFYGELQTAPLIREFPVSLECLTRLDPILYELDNRYYSIGQPIGVGYKETKR